MEKDDSFLGAAARRWGYAAFYGALFIFLFIFFTRVHMLVPFDGDDWNLISKMRHAFPIWGAWNPIKVLPEDLYPIAGYIAAYLVTPVLKDYVAAITGVSAGIYSLFITAYIYLFGKAARHTFSLPKGQTVAAAFIFFLLHFWAFKTHGGISPYFFGAEDLTCVFHYCIPAILNFSIVLYLWSHDFHGEFPAGLSRMQAGLLVLAVYLAVFSNIEQSIILVAFLGVTVLHQAGARLFHVKEWKTLARENRFALAVIVLWLLSLAIEYTGQNAHHVVTGMAEKNFFDMYISVAAAALAGTVRHLNYLFVTFCALVLAAAGASCWRHDRGEHKFETTHRRYIDILAALLVCAVYLILLGAKIGPDYLTRADVCYGVYVWLLFSVGLSFAYLMQRHPRFCMGVPIVLLVAACEVLNGRSTYQDATGYGITPETAYAIDCDLIHQLQQADAEGKTEIVLRVPQSQLRKNWPYPIWHRINRTLYVHGMTSRKIEITVQPDPEMNEKYHIPVGKWK